MTELTSHRAPARGLLIRRNLSTVLFSLAMLLFLAPWASAERGFGSDAVRVSATGFEWGLVGEDSRESESPFAGIAVSERPVIGAVFALVVVGVLLALAPDRWERVGRATIGGASSLLLGKALFSFVTAPHILIESYTLHAWAPLTLAVLTAAFLAQAPIWHVFHGRAQ